MDRGPSKNSPTENVFEEFDRFNLLRILIDTLPDQLYIKNTESRFVVNNIEHARDLGAASPEEIAGKTDFDFYPKELAEQYLADEREIFRSGQPLIGKEEPSANEEGHRSWHSTTKVPLRNGNGKIVGLVGMTQDITGQKKAEEALRESEERHRAVVEQTADAIFLVDGTSGRILESNARFQELLGYTSEELNRMSIYDVVPHDREGAESNIQHVLEKKTYYLGERHYRRKDGSLVDLEVSANLINYDGKEVVCAVARDISERKRAQEELQKSHAILRAVTEGTTDAIFMKDRQGRYLMANSACARFLEKSVEEIIGKDNTELFSPDTARHIIEADQRVMAVGETRTFEEIGTVGGVTRTYLTTKGAFRDGQDNIIGVFGISRDITERKQMEEDLKESEERYRMVVGQSAESIFLFDPDTKRVLESNTTFQKLVGYTSEELLEMTIHDFIAHDPGEIDSNVQQDLQEKQRFGERKYRLKDGSLVDVEVSMTAIPYRGREVLCTVARDITERKRSEQAVRESEERFRSLIQNASDIITILDADGTIRYKSPAVERILGYKSEEMVGTRIFGYIHPEDFEEVKKTFAATLENPEAHSYAQFRFRHADGSWRQMESIRNNLLEDPNVQGIVVNTRDVTERKEAESKLRRSEARLIEAQRVAHFGNWEWELPTDEAYWSDEVFRIYGFTPGEVVPSFDKLIEVVHPDDRELVREHVREALHENKPYSFDHRIVRPDGEVRFVHRQAEVVFDEEGEPLRMIGTVHDITERKEAEEKLKESEERFRTAFEDAPIGVALVSPERRYLKVNEALCEMLGYSEEELLGKTSPEITHPDDLEASEVRTHRVLEGEPGSQILEKRYIHADGHVIWALSSVSVIRDSQGEPSYCVTLFQDITERKQAEEELRKSERRFDSLTQNALDLITILDEDGFIRYESPAVKRVLGYRPEERIGKKGFDYVHPDDKEWMEEAFAKVLDNPGQVQPSVEFRLRHKDGSWRDMEVSRTNLLEDPAVNGIVANSRDVTERREAEEALKESEERYRAVFEESVESIYLFDPDTKCVLESNAAFEELIGYDSDELLGMTIYDFIDHDPDELDHNVQHHARQGKRVVGGRKYCRKDGLALLVEVSVTSIPYQGREAICCVVRNVTERKEAEDALRESEERFRTAFEDAPLGVSLVDLDGRRIKVNRALCEMLGYSEEELVGKDYLEVVHPEDRENSTERMRQALEGGPERYTVERRYLHADGYAVWNLSSVSLIRDAQGNPSHLVCLHQDTTERKTLEDQLRHQAFHDSMTGLPNRALFLDRLEHALARASRDGGSVAVLMVDLDDFKVINDSLGHDAGNTVLVEIAERLQSSVRPGDTVGRIFGDEFAVLLEAPSGMEEARRVTERIEERLQKPLEAEGQEVFVAPSIGIALGNSSKDQPKEILRHADLAMYAAKKRGKARYEVYTPSMSTRVAERMDLETELRRAIEHEEFEAHYQPIVELETGKIVSLEALARWRHPERGLVAAGDFIQVAEETGLIRPIGQWVIEEACRQAKEWREQYPDRDLLMSVNLSANQFTNQPNLIPEILNGTELEPGALEIEITERAVMDDAEFSLSKLQRLKGLGVSFAIDDYGMGYSCLYYLKRMPLDSLKIDRSFIVGLGEDPGDEAIVSGTVSLAHALGLKVVAEGVETERQLAKLKELGCDLAQGFHLAEPLPTEELSKLLAEDRRW